MNEMMVGFRPLCHISVFQIQHNTF